MRILTAMRDWRPVDGKELLEFAQGKTVADVEHDGSDSAVLFTDGSAIRCTAIDGTVYSEHTQDHATVEWEVSEGAQGTAPEG